MSAFDQARTVEARSLVVLEPFLTERHGRYVLTGKGRLARYLQECVGDLLFNDRVGNVWTAELKAELRHTGNLFLETFSNRNLDDPVSHAQRGCNVGWLYKSTADLLLYHFLDLDRLYVFNLLALKRWALLAPSVHRAEDGGRLPGRMHDFVELVQQKYRQPNQTAGRIVPIRVLERECRPPPKLLHPRQLLLDLGKA